MLTFVNTTVHKKQLEPTQGSRVSWIRYQLCKVNIAQLTKIFFHRAADSVT